MSRPFETAANLAAPHIVNVTVPGMAGLALHLAGSGARVSGSAPESERGSATAKRLERAGVRLFFGAAAGNVNAGHSVVIWDGAVVGPHPELDQAVELGVPVWDRARALAAVGRTATELVTVAGSHSTTTAAGALTAALHTLAPGWILTHPMAGATAGHSGAARVLIADWGPDNAAHEAARGSWRFLRSDPDVRPAITLITAADANPPHYEDRIGALGALEVLARRSQAVVLPLWEAGCRILSERLADRPGPRVITVGESDRCQVRVLRVLWSGSEHHVTVQHDESRYDFTVAMPGRHHALAAAAAFAAGLLLEVDGDVLTENISTHFRGVEDSLVTAGTQGRITVARSIARHPAEITADVQAARFLTEGAVIAVLEPDGHARSLALAKEIATAVAGADEVVLLPVNSPIAGTCLDDGADAIERAFADGGRAVHRHRPIPCGPGPEQLVAGLAQSGDLVLTIGTGQARSLAPALLAHLAAPAPVVP
ncbi:UDP-N-acetylmuramate--L-alanine ligase [Kitasatospora sp. NE20-6]|uniref:Mur ligase domain-containing protein n=1 Tax=Kitasatospora sp. NE20-6 TaxID=2859066 RepID=UPI0034DBC5D8